MRSEPSERRELLEPIEPIEPIELSIGGRNRCGVASALKGVCECRSLAKLSRA